MRFKSTGLVSDEAMIHLQHCSHFTDLRSSPSNAFVELTIVPHDELVPTQDVVDKTDPEHFVQRGEEPGTGFGEKLQGASVLVGAFGVGSYTGCDAHVSEWKDEGKG